MACSGLGAIAALFAEVSAAPSSFSNSVKLVSCSKLRLGLAVSSSATLGALILELTGVVWVVASAAVSLTVSGSGVFWQAFSSDRLKNATESALSDDFDFAKVKISVFIIDSYPFIMVI